VKWDVFISHAYEDKDFVRPLAAALTRQGLIVWYDEFALRVGDSLRRSIDRGLAQSRFGIVVLSPRFFAKRWTQYELDGLVQLEERRKVLLPIWHEITREELLRISPPLADRVAISSERPLGEILTAIGAAIETERGTTLPADQAQSLASRLEKPRLDLLRDLPTTETPGDADEGPWKPPRP
jgi:hypothetical protein